MKPLFPRLNDQGRQAIVLVGVNGFFWFAWAFGCYQAVYLQGVGFSASAMGVVNALSSVVGIASVAFWGMASDRIGSLRKVLVTVLIGGSLMYAMIPLVPVEFHGSSILLMCYIPAVCFFRSSMSPYAENLLVRNCNELRLNFGVLRGLGSFLFTVGSLIIAAWLPGLGVRNTFWVTGLFMLIPITMTFFAREPAAKAPSKKGEKRSMNLGELFKNKAYVAFLGFGFIFYIAVACEGNFLPYYMASIGVDSKLYGIILALRATMEIPFLLFMVKLRRRFPLRMLVLGAALLMSVECLGLGLLADSLPAMMLFCMFFGLGNGLFIGSSLNYVYELAPAHLKASAQAFFTSMSSVAGILGNLAGGAVFDAIGAKTFYVTVAVLFAASAGVFLLSFRRKPEEGRA